MLGERVVCAAVSLHLNLYCYMCTSAVFPATPTAGILSFWFSPNILANAEVYVTDFFVLWVTQLYRMIMLHSFTI